MSGAMTLIIGDLYIYLYLNILYPLLFTYVFFFQIVLCSFNYSIYFYDYK